MPDPMTQPTPRARTLALALFKLGVFLCVLGGLYLGIDRLLEMSLNLTGPRGAMMAQSVLLAALAAYTFLIALPFVPGIEIGISLMVLRGGDIAPFVYLATLIGLVVAFLGGRFLPIRWLARIFGELRLRRAQDLLMQVQELSPKRRLALLRQSLPERIGDWAVRWRYVALALVLNMPGNAVIGGGGGICLIAGLSGLFAPRWMLLTLALAVSPVPMAVWIFGTDIVAETVHS